MANNTIKSIKIEMLESTEIVKCATCDSRAVVDLTIKRLQSFGQELTACKACFNAVFKPFIKGGNN
jgi:hypothetical protein